ncbi:MAG: 4'-phosphopantetheinyl transferase superfamily protein [Gammaproteobacteria bacterium]|nr:4'-phosphopantetheinyl transferase superfamily protein [Gammaproteobacteria bacterium]
MIKKPFTPLDTTTCLLKTTRIDIYLFTLDTPFSETYIKLLSNEEKMRANRFHFTHHQHHFRRARIILRLILANYLEQAPENLQFAYGKHGKPYLIEHPELEFNLSHSGKYALLAVGKKHPLGIDIEQYSGRPYVGIGQHVFSDKENTHLKTLPGQIKPLMFFNIWAQKEAFIKLLGLGLSYPTTKLTVPGLSLAPHQFVDPIYKNTWTLLPFMPKIGYAAALCCHPSIEHIYYTTYSL